MLRPRDAAFKVNVGDMLACSGRGLVADLISTVSPTYTHVALIDSDRPAIVAESTSRSTLPDEESGLFVTGVQAHFLTDWLSAYDGNVWLYQLETPLTSFQREEFAEWIENERRQHVGYDWAGVMRLGAERIKDELSKAFTAKARAGSLFCSELATLAYQAVEELPETYKASEQTPDDAAHWPLFMPPVQLK